MQLDFLPREMPPVSRASGAPIATATKKKITPPPAADHDDDAHGDEKAPNAFKTISEAADVLGVPQHVLRFWESKFTQIRPMKLRGGRRYYRPEDMDILVTVKHLLYKQGYTIKGAKKAFAQHGKAAIHLKESPAQEAVAAPAPRRVTDKQLAQLAALRQELMTLRDALAPFVEA